MTHQIGTENHNFKTTELGEHRVGSSHTTVLSHPRPQCSENAHGRELKEKSDTLGGRLLAVLVIQESVLTQVCTRNRKKSLSLVSSWYLPSFKSY
jgi:hypothetical protein